MKRRFPHSKRTGQIFGFAAASASLAAFAAQAGAQTTIIDDNFTSGSQYGTSTIGLTPDTVNTPGGVWSLLGSGFGDSSEHKHTQNNVQLTIGGVSTVDLEHNGGAVGISLGSASNYLNISATLDPNGYAGSVSNYNAYVGLYPSVGTSTTASGDYAGPGGTTHLVGMELNGSGTLSYVINGVVVATGINGGAGAFDGTNDAYTTLSYDFMFNPVTDMGTFSNITLGGVSYSNTYTTGVLAAGSSTSAYAGFGAGGGTQAGFTNFTVSNVISAVPEPSAYASLGIGMLALGAFQYRRRERIG